MGDSNKLKSEKLGMSFSKANHILRKKILFYLAEKCGMRKCFRCGKDIKNIENFSIEHKISWVQADNPPEMFFDINNIAFSHSKCNQLSKTRFIFTKVGKSGYRGVTYDGSEKRDKGWRARTVFKGKRYCFGVHKTAIDAAKVYDEEVVKLFGDKAITNKKLGLL